MLKFQKLLQGFKNKNESGFSLIEMVVAIGIMLIITSVGLMSYSSTVDNARIVQMSEAIEQTQKLACLYHHDNDPITTPQQAVNNYNSSISRSEDDDSTAGGVRVFVVPYDSSLNIITNPDLVEEQATLLVFHAEYTDNTGEVTLTSERFGQGGRDTNIAPKDMRLTGKGCLGV